METKSLKQEELRAWVKDEAPVISGQKKLRQLKATTLTSAYKGYQSATGGKALHYCQFCNLMAIWGVRVQQYDQYACPYCYHEVSDQNHSAEELQNHTTLVDEMYKRYREQVNGLPETFSVAQLYVVMQMDYCRIHELQRAKSSDGKTETRTLSIFDFTLIGDRQSEECHDFLSFEEQGPSIMFQVVQQFSEYWKSSKFKRIKKIYLWSDGGLKTYSMIHYLASLSEKIGADIIINFHAPYHGHGRCDAHFGRGKIRLRREYAVGGLHYAQQVCDTFNELKNTTAKLLREYPIIEEELEFAQWTKMPGIRSYHVFSIERARLTVTALVSNSPDVVPNQKIPKTMPIAKGLKAPRKKKRVQPLVPAASSMIQPPLFIHIPVRTMRTQLDSGGTDQASPHQGATMEID